MTERTCARVKPNVNTMQQGFLNLIRSLKIEQADQTRIELAIHTELLVQHIQPLVRLELPVTDNKPSVDEK